MPTVTPRSDVPKTDMVVIQPIPGKRHKLRFWTATAAIALAVFTPIFFMLAALGTRVDLWSLSFGFGTLTRGIGPKLLMATIAVGLIALLLGLFIAPRRKRAITAGLIATAVGIAGLLYAASVGRTAERLPFIHDITTDTQNPPVFTGRILDERAEVEGVNTLDYVGKTDPRSGDLVSVAQGRAYKDIRTIVSRDAPDVAYGRALEVVDELGWAVKDSDAVDGRIEATDTTFWYGFKDDVVVRVRPGAGGGSVVDVRSVSRVGGSDLGANAARVRDFIAAFED